MAKKVGKSATGGKAVGKKAVGKKAVGRKVGKGGKEAGDVVLLSGGNPQIAKGDGAGPVRAYIAAMPGWKRGVGRRLDGLVEACVADLGLEVRKAVRWNSPFYGVKGVDGGEDRGWFLSYHCFDRYVKVTFLNGSSLRPPPPVASKHEAVRYFHIHEGDEIDEELVGGWIRQAAGLPGEGLF